MFEIGLTDSEKVEELLEKIEQSEKKGAKSSKGWRLFVNNLVYEFIEMGPKLIRELIATINSKNKKIEDLEAEIASLKSWTYTYPSYITPSTTDTITIDSGSTGITYTGNTLTTGDLLWATDLCSSTTTIDADGYLTFG